MTTRRVHEPKRTRAERQASPPNPLALVRAAAEAVTTAEADLETRRSILREAMRRAREQHTLAEVAKAAGISGEWVRRLTADA
jgi:hypothetical protein